MRSMKEKLSKISEKVIENMGEISIKTSEKSTNKCLLFLGFYEPKFPIEMLKENIKK